jgi:UDPglucose 6-dehydrogenase
MGFEGADAVVLTTEWHEYLELPWEELKSRMRTPVLIDGRSFLDRDKLTAAGYRLIAVP